jgi:S-methylmethionine-dependent homocysteine/selenocysteine methylase
MAKYRNHLPQLGGKLFLTDGGMETTLVFHDGIDLPCFASFDLLKDEAGRRHVYGYYARYAAMARDAGLGFVLESPTWRANADWAAKLGYDEAALAEINRTAISVMAEVRAAHETPASPMVISGNIGPRGDGYKPDARMSTGEAEAYHGKQTATFAGTEADLVSAVTLNDIEEAVGVVRAAVKSRMPVVISFTTETDGRLPTGETLREAIEATDAATGNAAAYYMINCAHPTHFQDALKAGEAWTTRIRGLRANASKRSHAELDEAPDLDAGDPVQLGHEYRDIVARFGHFNVLGGCCGTDHRHVAEICKSVTGKRAAA